MNHPAAECIPLFPEEEIPFILQALIRCCSRLKKKGARESENDLTDRLRMVLDRDRELAKRPTEIFREVSIYARELVKEKPLGRTDISFYFSTGARKPWPYFTIECKRLHVDFLSGFKTLVAEYVTGNQGMMCYVEQRYSRGLAHGAMLGYVFDGKADAAREAVALAIKLSHAKLQAHFDGEMQTSALSIAEIHETHHQIDDRLFIIHHLFVPV